MITRIKLVGNITMTNGEFRQFLNENEIGAGGGNYVLRYKLDMYISARIIKDSESLYGFISLFNGNSLYHFTSGLDYFGDMMVNYAIDGRLYYITELRDIIELLQTHCNENNSEDRVITPGIYTREIDFTRRIPSFDEEIDSNLDAAANLSFDGDVASLYPTARENRRSNNQSHDAWWPVNRRNESLIVGGPRTWSIDLPDLNIFQLDRMRDEIIGTLQVPRSYLGIPNPDEDEENLGDSVTTTEG